MVQGIAFLSKKSWHTKTLANQERVWVAEQRKAAEETKTKELARQIQQEREQEELDNLAGKKSHLDRGIDWMYQGHHASGGTEKPSELEQEDAEKKAEAYLLGKEFTGEGAVQGDFTQTSNDGVNAVVKLEDPMAAIAPAASASAAPGELSVADRNEAFRQQIEDPMFMVSQKEAKKKSESQKQRALYERVMGPIDDDDVDPDHEEDEKKKAKKERKRERKERRERKKKRHSRHHSSDDEAVDVDRRRERKRSRSEDEDDDSYDRKRSSKSSRSHHRKDHKRYDDTEDRKMAARERDNHGRHHRRRSRSPERKSRSKRRRSRSRSRSPDDSRRHHPDRRRDHHDGRRSHDRYHDHDEPPRSSRREDNDFRHQQQHHKREPTSGPPPKKAGFGLQGKAGEKLQYSSKELGPAQDLLRQKEKAAEEERRRARDRASTRRPMSAEERAQALEEMKMTAEQRMSRGLSKRDQEEDDAPMQKGDAGFLKDMTEEAHGLKGPVKSLEQRMREKRNTQQRSHDQSFL